MKIAIYSRGVENDQLKDLKQLLDELINFGVEPIFFKIFLISFILLYPLKAIIQHLILLKI